MSEGQSSQRVNQESSRVVDWGAALIPSDFGLVYFSKVEPVNLCDYLYQKRQSNQDVFVGSADMIACSHAQKPHAKKTDVVFDHVLKMMKDSPCFLLDEAVSPMNLLLYSTSFSTPSKWYAGDLMLMEEERCRQSMFCHLDDDQDLAVVSNVEVLWEDLLEPQMVLAIADDVKSDEIEFWNKIKNFHGGRES